MGSPRRLIGAVLLVTMIGAVLPSSGTPEELLLPPKKAAYFTHPIDPGTVNQTPAPPSPVTQRLLELIDAAAPRATIRVAVYYLIDYRQPLYAQHVGSIVPVEDVDQGGQIVSALTRALRRKVNVRVVTEGTRDSSARALRRLQREGATITRCDHGCAHRPSSGIMHDKFMLISDVVWTPKAENVIAQTSANWSDKQLSTQRFNNMIVVWDDKRLYRAYLEHFRDMEHGRRGPTGMPGDAREGTSVSFFPQRTGDTVREALMSGALKCTPTTTISIAMGMWTSSRGLGILRTLERRQREGCNVRVVVAPNMSIVTNGYLPAALPLGARCTGESDPRDIEVTNPDPEQLEADLRPSNHSKYVVINGPYRGVQEARTLFVGSANFTDSSLRQNDESWMQVSWKNGAPPENASVIAAYAADFERMWQASIPCAALHPDSLAP